MFLSNKYSRIYFQIVAKARSERRSKRKSYFEDHHIVPRCCNGTNDKTNRVLLTGREHFICHALLVKMVLQSSDSWPKLVKGFVAMGQRSRHHDRYFNSRLYSIARRLVAIVATKSQTGSGNSQFGTVWIRNGSESKKIKIEDLNYWLFNKWRRGREPRLICNNAKIRAKEKQIKILTSRINLLTEELVVLKSKLEERSGGVTVAVLKTECGRKSMEFESAPLPPECVGTSVN